MLPALARADGPDPASLFEQGLVEMKAEHYAKACPLIAESYRLDPHAGGLFTLAECEKQWGKIAAAINDFDGFIALVANLPAKDRARQVDRARAAAETRASLARDVPSITITLDAGVPSGSTVSIDGRGVPPASLSAFIPLDPGDHRVALAAPDGRKTERRVTLALRDARALTLTLALGPGAPDTGAADGHEAAAPSSSRRTAALVTAGSGAVAVVVGAVLGTVVAEDKSGIQATCSPSGTCASEADASTANSARAIGWGSTAAFIGGAALLGAGAVLWFTRDTKGVGPVAVPTANGAMVGLTGTF